MTVSAARLDVDDSAVPCFLHLHLLVPANHAVHSLRCLCLLCVIVRQLIIYNLCVTGMNSVIFK